MSDLRQRSPSFGKAGLKNERNDYTTSPTISPTSGRLFTRILYAVSAGAALFYISFLNTRGIDLPHTYALCSKDGPNIYTVDPAKPQVECIAIQGSEILSTGSFEEIQRDWAVFTATTQQRAGVFISQPHLQTRFIKPGSIVVPGLSDSHAHMLEYGASLQIPLESAKTEIAAVASVRQYILSDSDIQNNKDKFVEGWGWDHTRWPGQEFPTAATLDADPVVRERNVVLQSKDGHAIWVNSKVLDAISPLPSSVEGGVIVRDAAGNPTGCLLDNAQYLVPVPPPTQRDLEKRFNSVVHYAVSHGLTSVHDAGFDPKSLEFFKNLAAAGKLSLRIYGMTYFNESAEYWGDKVKPIIGAANGRFTARSVKIFADGALRSGGSALFEPYTDNPETRGFMRIEPEVMSSFIPRFLKDGWQVNVHAIGDRANALVLDVFESALKGMDVAALRPRIEHAQMIRHVDMARMARLNVIASIQPTHAPSDMYFAEDRLGPERVKLLYAFRSIVDYGARITLGSDAPVETLNPMNGFFAAVTRLAPDGTSVHGPDGWFPEQRLSREEALKGMTIDAAYASFTESTLGSLTPGKRADYAVLSKNVMTVPAMEILDTEVLVTAIDGRPVYGGL